MPLIVGIVIVIGLMSLFGGSKSDDDSFFRRRTFWERLTGEEPTFIEKVENFFAGVLGFAVLAFLIYHIFDILELIVGLFDLDLLDAVARRRR
ncbi:MAG: hypothetical protein IJ774_06680 [Selenomonadaceae bacterium]|nr:hypothetical protein [Selenomonadaceae bacterium]